MGCDQYQGFYFSPAVPAAEFEELLRKRGAPRLPDEKRRAEETLSKLAPPRRG